MYSKYSFRFNLDLISGMSDDWKTRPPGKILRPEIGKNYLVRVWHVCDIACQNKCQYENYFHKFGRDGGETSTRDILDRTGRDPRASANDFHLNSNQRGDHWGRKYPNPNINPHTGRFYEHERRREV